MPVKSATTIFKYELAVEKEQRILMPAFSKILSIKTQNNNPFLWAMIDRNNQLVYRKFITYVTGKDMDSDNRKLKYIDTYLIDNDSFAGHVYEEA